MHQSELVSKLIRPLSELDEHVSPKSVIMAAINWPTQGWIQEALDWIDQGVPIDYEIADALEFFAADKRHAQAIRHRAFATSKRWRRKQSRT